MKFGITHAAISGHDWMNTGNSMCDLRYENDELKQRFFICANVHCTASIRRILDMF